MATAQRPDENQQTANQGAQSGADWDELKEGVGEMAGAAVERGRHYLDSATEQATGYLEGRKQEAAQAVVDLANTLRESGGTFEGRPSMQALVDSAANGLEQLADTIRTRSVRDIVDSVEAVVRRSPAVAATATMAAGFMLARFIKASTENLRQFDQPPRRSGGADQWQGSQSTGPRDAGPGQGRV